MQNTATKLTNDSAGQPSEPCARPATGVLASQRMGNTGVGV